MNNNALFNAFRHLTIGKDKQSKARRQVDSPRAVHLLCQKVKYWGIVGEKRSR